MCDMNARQKAFVREYLVDRNGKQAAIRAGYSEKYAETQACRLLSTNAKVAAAVARGEKRAMERAELTLDTCIAGIKREAMLGDEEGGTTATRARSWEVLAKHFGLRSKVEVEHSGSLDLNTVLTELDARDGEADQP